MLISFFGTIINYLVKARQINNRFLSKNHFVGSLKKVFLLSLTLLLIGINVTAIFNVEPVEAADTFLFDKVITWGDGSTEHVQIGEDAYFYLDGVKTKLLGMCLSGAVPNVTYPSRSWEPENMEFQNKELDYLQSIGMRIIRFELPYALWMIDTIEEEEEAYINLLDQLYEHKMLVICGIYAKYIPGFNNLDNPDFEILGPDLTTPIGDTTGQWFTRCVDIISRYPNIVAVNAENEIDHKLKAAEHWAVPEDQAYTPENVRNYLTFMTGIIRQKLDVPITHNLTSGSSEEEIKQVVLDMVDIKGFDVYRGSYDEIETDLDILFPTLNVTGGWWNLEISYGGSSIGWAVDSSQFNSTLVNGVFDNGATISILWWTSDRICEGETFFDINGNPKESLVALADEIDNYQTVTPGYTSPVVVTGNTSSITNDAVVLNGSLEDLGMNESLYTSFEWGTSSEDYIYETDAQLFTNVGEFSSQLDGLVPGNRYYFRAKASGNETVYGIEQSFIMGFSPIVATNDITNVTDTSAILNGSLSDLGTATNVNISFLWGENPRGLPENETSIETTDITGQYSVTLTELIPGTTYYYTAKAEGDGISYGEVKTFTTNSINPEVITTGVANLTSNSVTMTGNLSDMGVAENVNVLFEWGTSAGVYTEETSSQIMVSSGTFSFNLTGLNPDTLYYYRAKAVGEGIDYGDELQFVTESLTEEQSLVSTMDASSVTGESATFNGSLERLGTADNVMVSFEWGLNPGTYINETDPQIMETEGAFHYDLTGLTSDTTYYYRAKAIGDDNCYGDEISFTTGSTPVIETTIPKLLPAKTSVILRWDAVDGATNYILQVSTSPDCNGEYLFNEDVGRVTKQKVKGLTIGTTYYWRLKAGNSNGFSDWSSVYSFIIE